MSKDPCNPHDFIPKPCREDWYKMTGDEKRRHCEKCDTHVVDLTDMSEDEIRALHQEKGGKLCGAFRLGPAIAKPLALGSGIASLALASCAKKEPVLPGIVCPPPAQDGPVDKEESSGSSLDTTTKKTSHSKNAKPEEPEIDPQENPPLLLGDICVPPPKPGQGPA